MIDSVRDDFLDQPIQKYSEDSSQFCPRIVSTHNPINDVVIVTFRRSNQPGCGENDIREVREGGVPVRIGGGVYLRLFQGKIRTKSPEELL